MMNNKIGEYELMNEKMSVSSIISWLFALIVFAIGLANLFWVHPVPGIIYLLLSLLYIPQVNAILKKRIGFPVPSAVKLILAIIIMMFTLGVSDLGDMIDKL